MNKIWLIIQREYVTRVRNKTFLLSTFLLPIVLLLFIAGSIFFASRSDEEKQKVAVLNDPGFIQANLTTDTSRMQFDFPADTAVASLLGKGYNAVLYLNADSGNKKFDLISKKTINSSAVSYIKEKLDKAFEQRQLENNGIRMAELDSISRKNSGSSVIDNRLVDDAGGQKKVNPQLNYMVGFGSGILIYITMFIFGAMVMRGVMEEKTNRIAEVMVSSIKPFQLMLGKIVGIGAVGLTQLLLWIILMFGLFTVAQLFIPHDIMMQAQQLQHNPALAGNSTFAASEAAKNIAGLTGSFAAMPIFKIIFCFIFYFIGGYLFYSSLFAAVGSVVNEDPQEAQSLMLPITMPIVFGFIILSTNINSPDNSAMFWGSMIPFTSPIVMMGRIASNPPWWQLGLSMLILIAGFLFTTWLAAKIYRTGILLYGKKVTWKEMFKWAFRKS